MGNLDKARLSKADDTAQLSALWDRLAFAKQAGRQVYLHATIFSCLASEAEREADKLVCRYEQRSTSSQPVQFRGKCFRSSQDFRRNLHGCRVARLVARVANASPGMEGKSLYLPNIGAGGIACVTFTCGTVYHQVTFRFVTY